VSLIYSSSVIEAKLQVVLNAIDGGAGNGIITLLAGGAVVSTLSLLKPSGSILGGVLTFFTPLTDPLAVATGNVTSGTLADSAGNIVAYNLSAGVAGSGADVVIFNGLGTTLVSSGQTVQALSAQIVGA
jgi:hypothetical protein